MSDEPRRHNIRNRYWTAGMFQRVLLIRNPARIIYWLLMIIALVVGSVLIRDSSVHLALVGEQLGDDVVRSLDEIRPGFSFAESERIRGVLRSWGPALSKEAFWDAMKRDLGIALVIAFILTLVIEFYARNRLQDEVRSGVVEATFRRLIAPAIFDEVKWYVMGAQSIKRNWNVEMVVFRDDGLLKESPNHYVSKTVISYELHNITGWPIVEEIGAGLDEDVTGNEQGGSLPRFERVAISDTEFAGEKLKEQLQKPKLLRFRKKIVIPGGNYVKVVIELFEIIRVPDTFVWSTPIQTEGARIVIDASATHDVKFEVMALHPARDRLQETSPGRTWEFAGGILPWQGFQIRSWLSGRS